MRRSVAHSALFLAPRNKGAPDLIGAPQEGPPRKGWQSLPPPDLPLVALMPTPTPAQRQLVLAYVRRQSTCQQLRD
jgi:hypothetical protein